MAAPDAPHGLRWRLRRQLQTVDRRRLAGQVLALAIGFLGAQAFLFISMPLPWMLGSMAACALASIFNAPLRNPRKLRSVMVAVLGVSLGSAFTPEAVGALGSVAFGLVVLLLAMAAAAFACFLLYRRFGGLEPAPALFAAMPGGLAEMIVLSESTGKGTTSVALLQATRIFTVVMLIPLWFRVTEGLTYSGGANPLSISVAEVAWLDIGLIALLAVLGAIGARRLNLPAALLIGPMLLSAVLHLGGATEVKPVSEFVAAAQLVLGTSVGARFNLVTGREAAGLVGLGLIGSLIMIASAAAAAVLVAGTTTLPFDQILLSFAPGGIAEMALMSLALGADVSIVVSVQVARIAVIIVAARLLLRFLMPSNE
ncbi:AbrB family transcriptional regulator [Afifella pfennigii]|uniref:AbrB family transcriptional regulator n=1 Tax=Afifella pfennigii TaxID=209897 RepID=UPI00068CA2CE|nr:AbrB family transcriptional regulator [Afifella pfennigii]